MIYIILGLIGAIIMFCGDMILYYTPEGFDYEQSKNQNVMQVVIDVMKNLPAKRVIIGGMIGPIAAFLYCLVGPDGRRRNWGGSQYHITRYGVWI